MKFIKFKKADSDNAAANSVSFIFIMSFIMIMMVSFIDVTMYFHTRNQLQDAAQAGARVTAMYGGSQTQLVQKYGGGKTPQSVVYDAIPDSLKSEGIVVAPIKYNDVNCTLRASAGRPVYCEVNFNYKGVFSGGSSDSDFNTLFQGKRDNSSSTKGTKKVRAYSVSEVTTQ